MTVYLSELTFDSDYASVDLAGNGTVYFNKISEDIAGSRDIEIERINLELVSEDETTYTVCSSVIGIGNDVFTLTSDYPELLGTVLTQDNISKCRLEVNE